MAARHYSVSWLLLAAPFIVVLAVVVYLVYSLAVGGVSAAVSALPLAVALLYLAGVLGAYTVYTVMKRHAEHEKKMIGFYKVIADYLSSIGLRDIEVVELQRIATRLQPSNGSPAREALLAAVFPPYLFYALHKYNRMLYEYEEKSLEVLTRLAAIARKHGISVEIDTRRAVTPRGASTLAASAVTGGLLAVLWARQLAREGSLAAERNGKVEAAIAAMLEALRAERPELLRSQAGVAGSS